MSIHTYRLRFLPAKNVLYVLRLIYTYILSIYWRCSIEYHASGAFLDWKWPFSCYVYHELQLIKIFELSILVGWKLFVVSLFWKRKMLYNFICVLVSKANTAVMLRKPKKKSNSYIFRWDPSFSIQLTKVLKCTVFQKYKIKQ